MKKIYYTVNRTENETDIICEVSAPSYPAVTFTYKKENFLEHQLILDITKHGRTWAINKGSAEDIETQIFDDTVDGGCIEVRSPTYIVDEEAGRIREVGRLRKENVQATLKADSTPLEKTTLEEIWFGLLDLMQ